MESQRGITLLELAIATAVLGLFIGALLVSIGMIKSATVRNFTNSIESVNSKVGTFRLKYNNDLPGDIKPQNAINNGLQSRRGQLGHGDGNGLIEGCDGVVGVLGCETVLFWRDLADAKLSSDRFMAATDAYVDGTVDEFKLNAFLPTTPFARRSNFFLYSLGNRNLYYVAVFGVGNTGALNTQPAMTPFQAGAVDGKMDDGTPNNGAIKAAKDFTTLDTGGPANTRVCVNSDVKIPAYNIDSGYENSLTCQLIVRAAF